MPKRDFDVEAVAQAIEADAGEALQGLRESLHEIKAGDLTQARIATPEGQLVRQARSTLNLTQTEFAQRINTPIGTLRDWEQGRFAPSGAALCLLRLLCAHPHLSEELA